MNIQTKRRPEVLETDAAQGADRIGACIRDCLHHQLKPKGVVLGLSGGIDSSVAAALCVRALGADRVLRLSMPQAESSPDTLHLDQLVADSLGIKTVLENITPILQAAGSYQRRH